MYPGRRQLYEEREVSTAQTLRTETNYVVAGSSRAGSLGQGNRRQEELHSETLHDRRSSPNINPENKTRRMRWAGHVASMRGWERCMQGCVADTRGKETFGKI
jgi:hypothetical protein